MNHSKLLLLNTTSLYAKIVVNTVVQLLATRLALRSLGSDAYGLYNLIAGVIVLLSFLNGSLTISVQRFLSISIGEKNESKLKSIFNVSLKIHALFALGLTVCFLLLQPFLFHGFLNIPEELHVTAIRVYDLMILSSAVTMLVIPYSACINAHEDLWFFAISEVTSALLKLWAAVSLLLFSGNLLLIYTVFMVLAIIVSALMRYVWCKVNYKECHVNLQLMKDEGLMREMFGFIGWNTLGSSAVVVRNQGIAVVLNLFFGTVVNAAYGVANQVNSLVLSFATTLTSVFTPMIIQQKGAGNEKGMIKTAVLSSKLSFFLSSMMALPIFVYMDDIFKIWLGNTPEYTNLFTIWILVSFLILQLYPGINRAIYATGKIKWYQIGVSICLIMIIPIGYCLLKWGGQPHFVIIAMAILQSVTLIITIYHAHHECGLDVGDYVLHSVAYPVLIFGVMIVFFSLFDKYVWETSSIVGILLLSLLFIFIYAIVYFALALKKDERGPLKKLLTSLIHR